MDVWSESDAELSGECTDWMTNCPFTINDNCVAGAWLIYNELADYLP